MNFNNFINTALCVVTLCVSSVSREARALTLSRCEGVFKVIQEQVSIHHPDTIVPTPESLTTLHETVGILSSIIARAENEDPSLPSVYRNALSQIKEVRQLGQTAITSHASSQDLVFDFLYKFSRVIDLERDSKQKKNSFFRLGRKDKYETAAIKAILDPPPFDLKSPFKNLAIGDVRFQNLVFPFQYSYVFKIGIMEIPGLFEDRETGKVYAAATSSDINIFDFETGGAQRFLRHDVIHVFIQKHYDYELFEYFDAESLKEKDALKSETNMLLKTRVREYQALPHGPQRQAVELFYFILLRELGFSYPLHVTQDLYDPKRVRTYLKLLPKYSANGGFGSAYQNLTRDDFIFAIDWVKQRANEDFAVLKKRMR